MTRSPRGRVAPELILALLESLRAVDDPEDQIPEEDIRETLPRRLGVSPVVIERIQSYKEHVRAGRRVDDAELASFIGLVARRPDAARVFAETGARIAAARVRRVGRGLPRVVRISLVRRRMRRALSRLFGRRVGGFSGNGFDFEMAASPLVQADPGGSACSLITGFCERALRDNLAEAVVMSKPRCETRGDVKCRWTVRPA